jgi:hypothetical protein
MDSSKAAAPVEKSLYINSDIRAEIKKFAAQKISMPAQTEMGNRRSQIEDDTPRSQVENNIEGIRSSIARLSSKSVDGLERLNSELQELQKLLRLEVERVQSEIASALAGIQVITDVIAPWKSNISASQSPSADARDVPADPPTSLNSETARSSG